MKRLTLWARNNSLGWPVIVLLVTIFVAISVVRESVGYQKITGRDKLAELLSGNTLQGDAFWFRYQFDGRMNGYVSRVRDEGTWYAATDHYCELWEIWSDGE